MLIQCGYMNRPGRVLIEYGYTQSYPGVYIYIYIYIYIYMCRYSIGVDESSPWSVGSGSTPGVNPDLGIHLSGHSAPTRLTTLHHTIQRGGGGRSAENDTLEEVLPPRGQVRSDRTGAYPQGVILCVLLGASDLSLLCLHWFPTVFDTRRHKQ